MHAREELGLDIGQAAQDAVAAAHAVDQVILVETGENRELGVNGTRGTDDLARVADGVDGVLDAADVLVRRGKARDKLGVEVGARASREVIEDHGQIRGLRDTPEVLLGGGVARPEVVRRYGEDRVRARLLGIAGEVKDIRVGGIAHADEDLHAAGNALDGKVDDGLLVLKAHAVELADASEQKHTVEACIRQVVQVLAPEVEVDLALVVGDGDGGAEDSLKHSWLSFWGKPRGSEISYLILRP